MYSAFGGSPKHRFGSRGLILVAIALAIAFLTTGPAGAIEHPAIDVDQLVMVPERSWGVSEQNPPETQTETLDVLVWDMVQSGDRMFVGGAFLNVRRSKNEDPFPQPFLAAFDVDTGQWIDDFRPEIDRAVYALDVLPNGSILVGGEFENVNGTARTGLVAIDEATGEIDASFAGSVQRPWSSRRAVVRDLKVEAESGHIYVGGNFSRMLGPNGSRITAFKLGRFASDEGQLDPVWTPVISGAGIWGLDTDPDRGEVAVSGFFSSVNTEPDSGHFHVVDNVTGQTAPGKIEVLKNDAGLQPETFDVVFGDGVIFHIGEQHMIQVLDSDDHERLGFSHTGATFDQFRWKGAFAGGAYQAGERIGDFLIAGCHCTRGDDNHYNSHTGRRTTRYNVMAYDIKTGAHIEAFDADISSPRDGHWAAASDTNGCLWLGGDYHLGGNRSGDPQWLGGFGRLCPPALPIILNNPGDQATEIDLPTSLQITISNLDQIDMVYTAAGLPTGLTINEQTGEISGTPGELGSSVVTVNATPVSDDIVADQVTFRWSVMDQEPPVLDPIDDRTVLEFDRLTVAPNASDLEGSAFIWRVSGLPSGLESDPVTGLITGAPTVSGQFDVTVEVTDPAGQSVSETFTIGVVNRSTESAVVDYTDYRMRDDDSFRGYRFEVDRTMEIAEFGVHDVDRNGGITNLGATTVVLYNATTQEELGRADIPPGAPLQNHYAYGLTDQPLTLEPGVAYIIASEHSGEPYGEFGQLTLADGVTYIGYARKTGSEPGFPDEGRPTDDGRYVGPTFRILGSASGPRLTPVGDQTSLVNAPVSFQPTTVEPEVSLSWEASGLPNGLIIDPDTGEITGVPTEEGTSTATLTVTAAGGLSNTTDFEWTIVDLPAPEVLALADLDVVRTEPISLSANLTIDDPEVIWSGQFPDGLDIDPVTGTISGAATTTGTSTVTVTATDQFGRSDSIQFTLTVSEPVYINAVKSHNAYRTRSGDYFLGYTFAVDREMTLTALGIRDADKDGVISNTGASTVALYNDRTKEELARVDVPAGTPVEGGFAWEPLVTPLVLTPGKTYAIAAENNGEPFAELGTATFIDGITPLGFAWKPGSEPGWPNIRGSFGSRFFGPSFRILGSDDGNGGGNPDGEQTLLPRESTWKYRADGANLGTTWRTSFYDDGDWPTGLGEFGFGDGDERTTWTSGYLTYYARNQFSFDGQKPKSLRLTLKADDGAVVYLNGQEILRDNMPRGTITANTPATTWRSGDDEGYQTHLVPADALVNGVNTVAVEVHNFWAGNNDVSFDLMVETVATEVEEPEVDPITLGSDWAYASFDDGEPANWKSGIVGGLTGTGQFGFGDGDEATLLTQDSRVYYFTHSFNISDPESLDELTLGLIADDGAVVYINGTEVHRYNMPDGPLSRDSRPLNWMGGEDELLKTTTIDAQALVAGENVVAVVLHNYWRGNSDLSFDLELRR